MPRVARERRECERTRRNSVHEHDHAILFRTLATLRTDIELFDDVEALRWNGPTAAFAELGARLDGAITEKRRRSEKA